ncbi:Dut dUTPase [uncultured Caudovirales phage]|uniref:dUTP diphosphatase n=1 Tax=uncultured Caudovirales phage TaxID=2100421 RepID=A0A6J5KPP3_9CAUD|nr:Dut dUTPase [uncultured Caudovirales phage]
MKLSFFKMNPDVMVPTYGTSMSTCFDLRYCTNRDTIFGYNSINDPIERKIVNRDFWINPGERLLVPTGLVFKITDVEDYKNYSIRLHARSGMALKRGLVLANAEGVVDVDYQQETYVMLQNSSSMIQTIVHQERLAQAEIVKNEKFLLTEISKMPEAHSERNGGFGSTGTA